MTAKGTFEVKLKPQVDEGVGDPTIGRMSIEKQFHGDLEAASKGQMIAMQVMEKKSAGYVAMERVIGTLAGHRGSFALQHSGSLNRGVPQLSVTVVPDSGTEELEGLTGTMTIMNAGGKHSYELEYEIVK